MTQRELDMLDEIFDERRMAMRKALGITGNPETMKDKP